MNRYLASGLGMTLGLLASVGRADDIVWRAARGSSGASAPVTPAAPAQRPAAAPTSGTVAAARGTDVSWIRARGQTDDPATVLPDASNPTVPTPRGEPGLPAAPRSPAPV